MFEHQARKRFGQNFLVDEQIIGRIVRAIQPKPDDNLVEIGPGQGAITAPLLSACPRLQVVELDRDLVPQLAARFSAYPEFKIHEADALAFDFRQLAASGPLRVVGNLPYNISTPLLFHLLESREHIRDMHFMLQKEVVERLAAEPGSGDYGRLSIMCQYHCRVEYLFDVGPHCFRPAPKVDSAIVRLTPHSPLPLVAQDTDLLETLVKTAFQQRRKTLRNALRQWLPDATVLAQLAIDPQQRPENLTVRDYVNLANYLQSQRLSTGG
jgi:16S rRNA (adenine1518-N6/adenine1519-N6)-dimethyltransferase